MSDNVFYTAVEAHLKWKLRLQKHLDGVSEEILDPDVICKDDQCVLGKWIYSDGQQYQNMPAYEELRQVHADFHRCAAEVIRKTDNGHKQEAEALFKDTYAPLSNRITRMLAGMHALVKGYRK